MQRKPRMRSKALGPLAWLLISTIVLLNRGFEWPYAVQFANQSINTCVAITCALSVPVCFWKIRAACRGGLFRGALVGCVALALPASLLLSAIYAITPSNQLQDALDSGSATYRVYLAEPVSAVSVPWTILRKELDMGLGLRLVRTVWSSEHHGIARLAAVNGATLRIAIDDESFQIPLN